MGVIDPSNFTVQIPEKASFSPHGKISKDHFTG